MVGQDREIKKISKKCRLEKKMKIGFCLEFVVLLKSALIVKIH